MVRPNAHTLVAAISVYSHAKLVDKALTLYNSMQLEYDIGPAVEHNNALVDVLVTAGNPIRVNSVYRHCPSRKVARSRGICKSTSRH